jgi:hypothetical protein
VPSVQVSGSAIDYNQAVGGNDNQVSSTVLPPSLAPNSGSGGAITVFLGRGPNGEGALHLVDCTLDNNLAHGGRGEAGKNGGVGGTGVGGGLLAEALLGPVDLKVDVTVSLCTVDHNAAIGGLGGSGGNGGAGLGGGFANLLGVKTEVTDTTINGNLAVGGFTLLGTGGDGLGGGMYNDAASSLVLTSATVKDNFALGGFGLAGFGQGIGGGVWAFSFETFSFDANTVIRKNHATTSNNDIFYKIPPP